MLYFTLNLGWHGFFLYLFALCCTFIDTVAETTLVAATSIHELHVGAHVGLASVAADRAGLAVIDDIERGLHREETSRYGNSCSSIKLKQLGPYCTDSMAPKQHTLHFHTQNICLVWNVNTWAWCCFISIPQRPSQHCLFKTYLRFWHNRKQQRSRFNIRLETSRWRVNVSSGCLHSAQDKTCWPTKRCIQHQV